MLSNVFNHLVARFILLFIIVIYNFFPAKSASITISTNSITLITSSVKMTSPQSGTRHFVGDTINLSVDYGTKEVQKVEYYSNNLLIATVNEAPFNFLWTNARVGMKEVTAQVYEENGKTATDPVTISVTLNVPPTVSLTNITERKVIQKGENLTIEAEAIDNDGSITKVEFYANDELIGEDMFSPYSLTWEKPLANTYQLKVKAIDDRSASASTEAVEVKVNKAPSIKIETPLAEQTLSIENTITFATNSIDEDGQISKVEFFIDGNKVGESNNVPFNFNWDDAKTGIFEIKSIATDEDGAFTESDAVKLFVINPNKPAAIISNITQDTSIAPLSLIPLNASISDGYQITKVEFIINGEVVGESMEAPYQMDLQVGEEGSYKVKLRAYYQGEGISESETITMNIQQVLSIQKGISDEIELSVNPNPMSDFAQLKFNLDKPQQIQLTITDLSGLLIVKQTVMEGNLGENTVSLALDEYPHGLYLLQLEIGGKRYLQKLLKQ